MTSARHLIAGLFAALVGAGSAAPASAQSSPRVERGAALQVEGVDVEQVVQLVPGVPLNFSVYGSPGAAAMLRIDGARAPLDLQERQPGVYEGAYVIGARDRIRADSRVTATLQRGGQAVHTELEESLQLARGDASVLDPTRAAQEPVAPVERVGQPVPTVAVAEAGCASCAVVESIRVPQASDGPGNLGAVSGTLIGAVFGERAREAHMRRMARIHGTVTGALTGRDPARDASYEVVFRLPDGATQTHRFPTAPALQVGDAVRLDGAGPARGRPLAPLR
jgi:outer membrane lipoprotein SlyB